ncbi:hypothetical protein [Motilibacter peucedani]|uniref:hypothetical protein n=1 Tax=Motilibacter peucedani TaxID=598650 RepID=UPI0011C4762E|nr:hypothetical protein [Motilibacter peucedani]
MDNLSIRRSFGFARSPRALTRHGPNRLPDELRPDAVATRDAVVDLPAKRRQVTVPHYLGDMPATDMADFLS